MNKRGLNILFISVAIAAFSMTYVDKERIKEAWNTGFDNSFGVNKEDITDMYSDYIDGWKVDVRRSFDEAEAEVYKTTPTPDVVGPDPDPEKCICGGSGVIVQGDGHKTVCPYHGNKFNRIEEKLQNKKEFIVKPLLKLEQ
tara:strand:+ start:579 stop:1001 length:423 start_codon:yes stop_codon:yes gene_type:complete